MSRFHLLSSLICCSFIAQLEAVPPPAPSAGVVERELEKEYGEKPLDLERELPEIQIDIPQRIFKMAEGKRITVERIEIQGHTSISSEEILSWLGSYLNRELSLRDIYEACHVIDHHYRSKGYFLARAYPPSQRFEKGTLRIEVLEGKLGHVQVVGNQHYSESFIQSYFASLQGKTLQYDVFVRALMLLNDNSDLVAKAIFKKGKKFGCADVILKIRDARPLHLYLNGNNYGRDLTTNVRVGERLDWGNLITQGDKISLAEVVGFPVDALYFTHLKYAIPLNRQGTSFEVAYLFSRFKIEELRSLHLKGRSDIATLKVNHALIRKRFLNFDLFSYFDYKQIQNFVLGHRTAFDKLRPLTLGAFLDRSIPSSGRDALTLRFAAGIPHFLGGLKSVSQESSRVGGGGRFFIFNVDYDRIQVLPQGCFFYFHGSGQLTPSKLPLPEQLYLGGVDTVRGFPLAIALGDSGYYFNGELRFPLPFLANKGFLSVKRKWGEVVQLGVFLDHGGAFLQSARNRFLWGSGLGIKVFGPYNLNLSIDVGFPLNDRRHNRGVFAYIKIIGQPF